MHHPGVFFILIQTTPFSLNTRDMMGTESRLNGKTEKTDHTAVRTDHAAVRTDHAAVRTDHAAVKAQL